MSDTRIRRADRRLAWEAPTWALGFYLRNPVLVIGLSLIPAAQRFGYLFWEPDFPFALDIGAEIITEAARVLLIYLVVRIAILPDPRARSRQGPSAGQRVTAFINHHWPSLVYQALILALLFVVFGVIPERIVPLWVPDSAEDAYWAVLLAVKNLTVIAFTWIWLVSAFRQMLIEGGTLMAESSTDPAGG